MVGTGVFTSLGFQVGELPSGFTLLVLWLLGGVCALCGALAYGELAAALPRSGGEFHFLGAIYHPAAGTLAGWLSIAAGFAAPVALAAMAFGEYFSGIAPDASPEWLSVGLVIIVTLVHLRGVEWGSVFQNAATLFKVLLIVLFIAAGFLMGDSQPIRFLPEPGDDRLLLSAPFAVSLVYVMYAYSGWNASAYIAGEIRDPARNVPLSLTLGTLLVTALYLGLNATFLRAAPLAELEGEIDVGRVAAIPIFGPEGGRIISGLICIGLVSTVSAMTWIGPRVGAAMGEDLPALRWLARRSASGVPAVAILFQTSLVAVLLLTGTFEAVLRAVQFSLTLCSAFTVAGVFVLRWTRPDLPRPYRTWGYPVTPALFLLISAWMLWHIAAEHPLESIAGLLVMLFGLVLYLLRPGES
ncbi:MAG: amino acid permease [Verrucomicrobiota bacterium]|nr:amino acid permease [Verrucomicrobiota bacterium]